MKLYIFAIIVFLGLGSNQVFSQGNYDFEISKNLDIYYTLWKQLNTYYVDELQPGKLNKTAIDEMLKSLDPYTNYYPEADIEDVRFLQTGKYGGVGSMIHIAKDTIIVTLPYYGFPMYNAGIRAGDKLISIDNKSIIGKTQSQVTDILRGVSGTKFSLTYMNIANEVKTVEIQRSEIEIKNVPYFGMIDSQTAYIKLTGFTEKAAQEISLALDSLEKTNTVKNLILDLRDNGGGLLQQAVEIMNLFIPAGETIVFTKGKTKDQNITYKTMKPIREANMKIVVLVNKFSASASEIVAGSMQDLDRGVIMGQKSYGKGLVQKVYPLSYQSQVKITVAKYYVPSGRCIQAIDYEHRDENGKATKIADSLSVNFKTKNGRLVKDAGGIIPDIAIPEIQTSQICTELQNQWMIFDFVSLYLKNYHQVPDIESFIVDDKLFDDFKIFIQQQKFEYKIEQEKILDKLIEKSKTDSANAIILSNLESIKNQYQLLKSQEFEKNKESIKQLIRTEIIARFYFESGIVKSKLANDIEIKSAIELFANELKYQSILKP